MTTGGRRLKQTIVRGSGTRVWDDAGKEYFDFIGGWAVTNLGHCHPAIVEAVQRQVATLLIASNDVYTIPQIQLAEQLVARSCLDRVYFCNSGAEANESAVKLARKWGKLHRDGAFEVITADHSFHGRTIAMLAATGKPAGRPMFEPMTPGFVNVPYGDIAALRAATTARTAAVMLEPVQGEGGVIVPERHYLEQVRAWCDEQQLLLIFDEVQTGCGRLGSLFGYQHFGVEPDVMTLSKGLGGGVPVAALLAKQAASVFTPGDHGTTFGGNPLVCAAALASFQFLVEHDVAGHAKREGEYFIGALRALQARHPALVTEIRGVGLLVALELGQDRALEAALACVGHGLLVNAVPSSQRVLRFMPPLTVARDEIDAAVRILDSVVAALR
jgi:acetylornithine/N-succinyldiaminopimelate aminotransferase